MLPTPLQGLLILAHIVNGAGALAALWGRPVFASAAIVLAAAQIASTGRRNGEDS